MSEGELLALMAAIVYSGAGASYTPYQAVVRAGSILREVKDYLADPKNNEAAQ
jgi:hypothetical protein